MGFLKALFGATANSSLQLPPSSKEQDIGQILLSKYTPLISSRDSAKKAALSVLWHGKSQFMQGSDGNVIRASAFGIPLPARLQSFADRFYDEENLVVSQEVVHMTYGLTRNIEPQVIQIETIYLIAEAIVENYGL